MGSSSDSGSALGYAGPIGLLADKPEYQTDEEFYANQLTGGIAGAFLGDPIGKNEQRRMSEEQLREEQARQAEQRAIRDRNLGQLRAVYGIGDSPEAQASASTLADFLGRYYKDLLSTNLREADSQFATTSRRSRQNLARVGQLGSGLDAQSSAGNLSDYLRARQQAVVAASGARDRLSSNLTGQRLGFESQISGGSMANPDFGSIAAQRDAQLQQAQSQITPAAIGHLFNVAGQGYMQGRIQEAQGNQGMQAFGFSGGGSGSRGRIS